VAAPRVWPIFGLRVRTDRLELRYPSDADLEDLARMAAEGVHDPEVMPFVVPWTDAPPGELERGVLQYHWGARAALKPDDWNVELVVVEAGRVVGAQGMRATGFRKDRTVVTGSWLGRDFQGRGLGREMRGALLDLAFFGLGAEVALSGAFVHNPASQRVSAAIGYRMIATDRLECRGVLREPSPDVVGGGPAGLQRWKHRRCRRGPHPPVTGATASYWGAHAGHFRLARSTSPRPVA